MLCRWVLTAVFCFGLFSCNQKQASSPNILIIVADDLGHAELGAFGGDIPTPNLDKLAMEGVRLTQFRVSPVCSATRSMLFTGIDNHFVGLGNMEEELAPNQIGKAGYEGFLNDKVHTIATVLQDNNYRTFYSGKWHLGKKEAQSPKNRGFDYSFAMLAGGSHHFDDMKPAYAPNAKAKAPYRDNGKLLQQLPATFRYSTQYIVDRLIADLKQDSNNLKDAPFFAVLSHMAPHWPLQAPNAMIDKFRGSFDEGFDIIAKRRLQRQKQLGIVPQDAQLAQKAPKGKNWDELSSEQKKVELRAKEIFAAMVFAMDWHTGRLVDYLQQSGKLQNTVIIFLSDNGAEGHDLDDTWPKKLFPKIREQIDKSHNFSFENMGKKNSYVLYGPNWARAGAPAFKHFKGFVSEGGLRVPAFIYYPQAITKNSINLQQWHVTDIFPTILHLAKTKKLQKNKQFDLKGFNIIPHLKQQKAIVREEVGEILGKSYVLQYPWKITKQPKPFGSGKWQLYNLERDLAESNDLAHRHPKRLLQLQSIWQDYSSSHNVILPNWLSGY